MPNIVTITRGEAAPALTRGEVQFGQVFSVKHPDGRVGRKYASLGHNGRMYSVNIETGELASSANSDSKVVLVGTWVFQDIDRTFRLGTNRVGQAVRRSAVRPGEVFTVKGGDNEYFHIGRIEKVKDGWLSVRVGATDHAVTKNGDSNVTIVGTSAIAATVAR